MGPLKARADARDEANRTGETQVLLSRDDARPSCPIYSYCRQESLDLGGKDRGWSVVETIRADRGGEYGLALGVLTAAPLKWPALVESVNGSDLRGLEAHAVGLAEAAARLAGYVSGRTLGLDHAKAVGRSNAAGNAVRDVIGYSRSNLFF
jgi:hypothetical protein